MMFEISTIFFEYVGHLLRIFFLLLRFDNLFLVTISCRL